jgi:excisionase family DNA binding protein
MSEMEKLYTVENIAGITGFTSRTIRNYLKDGILKGRKMGGQWRFTMEDIKGLWGNGKVLTESKNKNRRQVTDFLDGAVANLQGEVQVCTIADCYCDNREAGQKLYEKLVKVIDHQSSSSPARFDYDYFEEDKKARFTLFGDTEYIITTLQLL